MHVQRVVRQGTEVYGGPTSNSHAFCPMPRCSRIWHQGGAAAAEGIEKMAANAAKVMSDDSATSKKND